MKKSMSLSVVVLVIGWLGAGRAFAQEEQSDDKTLAPYFFIPGGDENTDKLPLKSTRADVKIAGVIADVTITQIYKNEGKKTIEAVYVFPGSTRSAVYAMRMTIGERVIEAEIQERQKAREMYEEAKREGKTASLLEQQRPNVFQMNVANILPGDEIKVELRYTELLEPEENVYEFVLPAVVGPRYSNTPKENAPDTKRWVENPYLHEGEAPPFTFGLGLEIKTGIPIAKLESPSHDVNVEYTGKAAATVKIKDEKTAGNRDFVLRYRLAGDKIETGLLLYKGKEENFFLMMMEPPARVTQQQVVPREYIFIVDVSGSMNGFPLDTSKALMEDIIGGLRSGDFINVLLFAGGSAVLSEKKSLPASEANKKRAMDWIREQQGGGGTEILPALKKALSLPKNENVSRIVVIATDGYVDVEPEAFDLIKNNLGRANMFAFGIGTSVNRYLIEGMARVGMGEPFVVLRPDAAKEQAEKFRKYIESPVLTGIKVSIEGFKTRDEEPAAVPDMFAQRPIVMFGKWEGAQTGRLVVSGKSSKGEFIEQMPLSDAVLSEDNAALRLLWARHRIMRLADMNKLQPNDDRVKEVTQLGLKYSLMTEYTSFVAIDKIKRADGQYETVKQPLPMPQGVSDNAVGGGLAQTAAPMPSRAMRMYAPAAPAADMAMESEAGPMLYSVEKKEKSVAKKPASGESRMKVSIDVSSLPPEMSKSDVVNAITVRKSQLRDCVAKNLSISAGSKEEVTLKIKIGADGKAAVDVDSSTISDKSIQSCIKLILKMVKFPKPAKGAAEIVLKITFEG